MDGLTPKQDRFVQNTELALIGKSLRDRRDQGRERGRASAMGNDQIR
jgi:hypothetical protein